MIWVSMVLFLMVSVAQYQRILVTGNSRDVSLITWICATVAGLLMVVRGFMNGDMEFVIAYGVPVVAYIVVCFQVYYWRK